MSIEMTSRKFLSGAEIAKLQESLKLCSPRDRLIFRILLETGCRGCELRDLRPVDVNKDEGVVVIRGKKRGKTRQIPLPRDLMSELVSFLRSSAPVESEPIFELSRSGLKFLWYRVRPSSKGIHALRHSFAVQLYTKTKDLLLVQYCMGHRSINSTLVYAQIVEAKEKMQKALPGGLYA